MALNIITPAQPILVKAIKLYFYGDPGMYKTTLGMTADKPLIIDADKGAYRTGTNRRGDVVIAENWLDIANITEEDLVPYNTVVFDTIGRVLDLIKAHLANNSKNTKSDGSLKLNVQGVANNMFSLFVNKLIGYGKDVVFIAHATEDKNDTLTLVRPDLGGKNRQEIYRLADAMAYLAEETDSRGNSNRVLKFKGGEGFHTKDSGNLGNVIVPDLRLKENSRFMATLIEQTKAHLNTLTPEQQHSMKMQQEWTQWQKSCEEAQYTSDFNVLLESLDKDHPYFKDMWECMKHYAKELGFTYNKEKTKWLELEIVPSTINDSQRDEVQDLLEKANIDVMTFCEEQGIDSLMSIQAENLEAVKAYIINKIPKQGAVA
ncbi:ATP-binding protein [Acinetobacter radioresistens]|uniref:ATP-binding protein n=1 Tax=Acinetobacter radioresistens TaxID=40216 RepID=UPI000C339E83|nr:ATP-binding protein [Acinetobacter radioresistens]PKH31303.1 AAA family ATPase [Acinetobacter radioresistens]